MHLSRAYGGVRTHPVTMRLSQNAGERPLPVPPFGLPVSLVQNVDKFPLQQPLIKDLAGGGGRSCTPETNVPDALLLSALVFTESQAGIRFPLPPPPTRRGDKEPCAAALELGVAVR